MLVRNLSHLSASLVLDTITFFNLWSFGFASSIHIIHLILLNMFLQCEHIIYGAALDASQLGVRDNRTYALEVRID